MSRNASFRAAAVALLLCASFTASAGPKAYVGNFKDNTVSVIDTGTNTAVATIPVAAGPHGMIATPDGRTLYVSGEGSSSVSVIDTASDQVVATIDVGRTPHGLAMSPDGSTLLVAVYGDDRVAFVDTASRTIVGSVPVRKPHTIAIRPDGKVAYAASQEPGAFGLAVIDPARRAALATLPLDKPPRDLEFAYDGRALYFTVAGVNAVQVLDPASDKVVASIETGVSPHVATLFRGAPAGTAVVQGPGELLLFDPATNRPLRTIAVGRQPHWIAASADGRTVYVTNEGSNDVTVVDLSRGTTASVPVGNAPRKVVVQRVTTAASGATVSIANFAFTPADLVVAPGQRVTWRNDDGAPHGIAFADAVTGKDLLLPGASFERVFDAPGAYMYACSVHPYMRGRVVVHAP